jgi:hypothetical protein
MTELEKEKLEKAKEHLRGLERKLEYSGQLYYRGVPIEYYNMLDMETMLREQVQGNKNGGIVHIPWFG